MRKAALLGLCMIVSGCAGFDKFVSDTATLPGENPNAPSGEDLNMRRIRGQSAVDVPILPEGGNMWPGPPTPLPTLEDVEKDRSGTVLGGESTSGPQLPDGEEMSIGEKEDIRHGVVGGGTAGKLPDAEPDVSSKYGAHRGVGAPIEIPNDDGTITLIQPDGSVSTIKDNRSTVHH
ncbi:hypothetical protein BJI49_00285 [Acetobacter pasteurianus]|uniref:DUF3035 domain-containing protein n=4 Tax=Acetobacter pasteurianus TaxID=438 RepID=C7JGM7_ACEP3|nr:hypothetical protein [Acetobacter pasteurianus]CCT60641.1 hypothetical protein APA386B_2607 [Acetobacter pasteurianus 386B]BAU38117.1 hypothetical protein APT_01035 [Acetobacter pasteurianus NBRC 101655]GCD61934.1 hypothetical protein NBRC3278_1027 [Acetobacter pasteurianus NBRC 3278]GCD68312.1 hypothetical protein NBRC3280_0947 [Acetobacter pasteurianus NBRC 3280]ASC04417.1 hypothetical protein S101468_00146 [Acetobacter pasteurianus subsp. pasteurianus]